jgi:hypothetical protein
MTALKINRFNLDELKNVSVVCKKCGARMTYSLDGKAPLNIRPLCYNCDASLSEGNDRALSLLRELFKHIKDSGNLSVEFDITED